MSIIDQEFIEQLKRISITGRMALGITCLENILRTLSIECEELSKFISLLWKFTSSNTLDDWEEQVCQEVELLFRSKETSVSQVSKIPLYIFEIIDEVIEIGRGNLYCGIREYSEYTLFALLKVLNSMEKNNFAIPRLDKFKKSSFSEFDGWGNRVDPSYFKD
jgi:hypothetical protein